MISRLKSCNRVLWYPFAQLNKWHLLKDRGFNRWQKSLQINLSTSLVLRRCFRSTSIHPAAPLVGPVLLKLMSPISRLFFILIGRRFRKWWQLLPPQQKNMYIARWSKNRNRLLGIFGAFGGLSIGFFIYHLEESPTGRKRFMLLTKDQLLKIIDTDEKNVSILLSKDQLSNISPPYIRVFSVVKRLFEANGLDQSTLSANVFVINSNEVNAFVLADGRIFVLLGMVNAVANDDELAGIIGHELSHFLLNHTEELLSRSGFINVFSIAIVTVLWAIVPNDFLSIFTSWLHNKLEDILLTLPYSRKLEKEADEIGMLLAAKACYDVKQIPQFWERMHAKEESSGEVEIDWFSTHPSHNKRESWLNETLPKALSLREENKCPQLNSFYNAATVVFNK